ncbi:TetR/AcrR family transcriptional regulator [Yinghuangia seranimata]|uniref:TetR/AcrR family transcriptional regulator n=1 Tax=Yinghuangia seranimata TaxID=408067 RepID=UPI00248CB1DF|nr:TetR/AcrR family transcriptional regulator [Yinghuangia seranimata]MDI2127257.1 TetR/AcrR family transcriptional regulator [Yinghuangia seranimata]MDI2132202.1 TetR/AcrR family transcriptional regulator [Yinghuangia seranimata]
MSPEQVKADSERRSRLTSERTAEVLDAVVDILREVGYEALTMDAVAARAKSSKATLYRQWQNKTNLVIAAMHRAKPVSLTVDTGSLVGDLHAIARSLARFAQPDGELLTAMGHAVMKNPELGDAMREQLIRPEREAFEDLVRRAIDRGELAHRPAATEHCGPILVQQVIHRPVCEGHPVDEDFLISVVDTVILPALRNS